MKELRWLLRVAPPFAALAAVVALGSGPIRATAVATGCAAERALLPAAQASPAGAFVIRPLLDGSGALAGQRLELGTARREALRLELPAESFAAGPFGRTILVGSDDGRRSTLRAGRPAPARILRGRPGSSRRGTADRRPPGR